MAAFDPTRLAQFQLARDKERTSRFPKLLARKIARMSVSPLAFLRGAAPMFYEILRARPELAKGPGGEGWIAGDLHLENFGAYRPDSHGSGPASAPDSKRLPRDKDPIDSKGESVAVRPARRPIEFNLNDFDEAIEAPWRLDVLRVMTSLILAGRELGTGGPRALELCERFLDAYSGAAFAGPRVLEPPKPVALLVEKARTRPQKALLDGRTEVVKGKRRLVRGERYFDLPREIAEAVPAALARYAKERSPEERPNPEQLEIVDAAFRVAGTGSLGAVRVAVLVNGKGGDTGGWIFDIKEQGDSSAGVIIKAPSTAPAERVVTAIRACVARPPRMVGVTTMNGISMLVRRLAPQEDKLDLTNLPGSELDGLARYLGALTATAHRRGATKRGPDAWTLVEREQLIDSAVLMAGVHEAAYLTWCRITR